MTTARTPISAASLREALTFPNPSVRLQTALSAGMNPHSSHVDVLIERCATEPDFYVRDMLTWSLTRHPAASTVPRLLEQTTAGVPQARSQALHTLSKIGDPRGWAAVTSELLHDSDDDVAKSAWRAAVVLVPAGSEAELARALAVQLGRGDRNVQLSLSRALVALGDAASSVLLDAADQADADVRSHAIATQRLVSDPDEGFDFAIFEAKRLIALKDAPIPDEDHADR